MCWLPLQECRLLVDCTFTAHCSATPNHTCYTVIEVSRLDTSSPLQMIDLGVMMPWSNISLYTFIPP